MICEVCGSGQSSIEKTEATAFHGRFQYVVRARKCSDCRNRYKTIELPLNSVPFANPAMLAAIRQLAKAAKEAVRMAEATEHFLINEAPNE